MMTDYIRQYGLLYDKTPIPVVITSFNDGKILYINNRAEELFEVMLDDAIGLRLDCFWPDSESYYAFSVILKLHGQFSYLEEFLSSSSGKTFYALVNATLLVLEDTPVIIAIFTDISAIKNSNDRFQESVNAFFNMFRQNSSIMLLVDPEKKRIVDANKAAVVFYGYPRDVLCSLPVSEINQRPEKEITDTIQSILNNKIQHYIFPHRLATGEIRNVEVSVNLINIKDKILLLGIVNDITHCLGAEEALWYSEEAFTRLFNSLCLGIAILLPDKESNIFNESFHRMTGYERKDLIRNDLRSIFENPADHDRLLLLLRNSGIAYNFKTMLKKMDGTVFYASINVFRFIFKGELATYVIIEDTTALSDMDKKIQELVLERETLVSEIHHRVNNSLQVVHSLIGLDSEYRSGTPAVTRYLNIQNKIMSMAFVYNQLYESKNFTCINFNEYVNKLSRYLLRIYGTDSEKITLAIHCDNIDLDINQAIPCGLILNELITNSLQHAFTENSGGEIHITMAKNNDGKHLLFMRDNGVGISSEIDPSAADTLGLQLVYLLTRQIHGRIEMRLRQGTEFLIVF